MDRFEEARLNHEAHAAAKAARRTEPAALKLFEMTIPVKVVAATEAEARAKLKALAGHVWKSELGGEILFESPDDGETITAESRF